MDKLHKYLFKNVILLILVILFSYYLPNLITLSPFTNFFFPPSLASSGFLDLRGTFEHFFSSIMFYTLLSPLFFMIWGGKYKKWWIVLAVLPVFIWLISHMFTEGAGDGFNFIIIISFILLVLLGAGIGFLLSKLLKKNP